MTKMDKSFLFYLKNWDTMEALSEDDNAELFSQDISGVVKCKDKYDEIINMADEYFRNVFSKEITDKIVEHVDSCGLKVRSVRHKHLYWHQRIFFDISQEGLKKEKWCLAFEIDKYNEKISLLCYIVRWSGKTMTFKPTLDKIFETSKPNSDESLYHDSTYIAICELPTDYQSDIDSDNSIAQITTKIISAIPKNKLYAVLELG